LAIETAYRYAAHPVSEDEPVGENPSAIAVIQDGRIERPDRTLSGPKTPFGGDEGRGVKDDQPRHIRS
jgi:hypothetical protein